MDKQAKIEPGFRRAAFVPNSYNADDSTVEVVFATETPVKRYDWWNDQYYNEVLEISEAAVDMTRLAKGAPVLNSHRAMSLADIIGVVESATVDTDKKEARAVVRLSNQPSDAEIVAKIQSGMIRNISVGYDVNEYLVSDESTNMPTYRATNWQPMEISFVPVPADYNSQVRGKEDQNLNIVKIKTIKSSVMEEQNTQATEARATEPQTQPAKAPEAPTTQPVADTDAIRKQAVADERKRVADITEACTDAGLDAEFTRSLIAEGVGVNDARGKIIKEVAKRSNPAPTNQGARVIGMDETDQIREAIVEGLMERSQPGSVKDFSKKEKAQQFRRMRLLDLAKQRVHAHEGSTPFLADREIVKRAITTTDFPDLLKGTFDRFLQRIYSGITQEWTQIARPINLTDMNIKTGVLVDGRVTFEQMPELAEYKEAKLLQNSKATIQLQKYGRKFSISDIAIINDDLNIFTQLPRLMAFGAADFQSNMIWDLIKLNKSTPDNIALFDYNNHHNTVASTGATINETTLNEARLAIRKQKSPSGNDLGLTPTYLIVPPDLQLAAEKMLTAITANDTDHVNTFNGTMQLIVSSKLTDPKKWYVVADPNANMVDGIVYGYLDGQQGLATESTVNFNNDALEIKGSLFFAATLWGYQGWFMNPGQ